MNKLESLQLTLVIEKLHGDTSSLNSCLTVNKLFCETSVRILWKDPMASFLNENCDKRLEKAKSFFNTILLQLSAESRKLLTERGINDLPQQQKPSFDYVGFCKYIRHIYSSDGKKDNDIYENVFGGYNESQRDLLRKEIYKLFIRKCSALKFVDITNIHYPLYEFPGAETSLSELNQLSCDDKHNQLLVGMAQKCKSIEKLHINITSPNYGLTKLIGGQQNLKAIIIKDNVNESNSEKQYETVGEAIIKHVDNLVYLDLTIENVITFYNNLLTRLSNIQKLVLYDSRYRNVAIHKQLKFSSYPKLQVLQIGISFSVAVKIIHETAGSLKMIWMDKGNQESEEQIGQLIQAISQRCQNLKFLKIYLKNENLDDFNQLLIQCKSLEGLYIYRGNIYADDDGKRLLDILIESAPANLRKFQL